MFRSQTAFCACPALILLFAGASIRPGMAAVFSGEKALAYTREAVADGPRPSGSPAIRQLQQQIDAVLKQAGCETSSDEFVAFTPAGKVPMRNILCKFPGKSGKQIVITGHYDTKRLPGFVGANDGGSSTGFLMEMAMALSGAPRVDDVILVFFDGEEAVREWTSSDSVYGSRHLAAQWTKDGTLGKIKALINVDMIGDKDLDLLSDISSNAEVRDLIWTEAEHLGYGTHFPRAPSAIEDDHMPFLKAGVRAVDLIDFTYGPNNAFWHNENDTMDKLSAQSFTVVGTVVLRAIQRLEEKP